MLRTCGKNTEEKLYKNDLNDLDKHDGVVTHLEPEILKCEVKRAFGSITKNNSSGDGRFQLIYFRS